METHSPRLRFGSHGKRPIRWDAMGLQPVRQAQEGAGSSERAETVPPYRIAGLQGLQYVDGPEPGSHRRHDRLGQGTGTSQEAHRVRVQFIPGAVGRQQVFPARAPLARDLLVAAVHGKAPRRTKRAKGTRRPMPVRGRGILRPRRRPTREEALWLHDELRRCSCRAQPAVCGDQGLVLETPRWQA